MAYNTARVSNRIRDKLVAKFAWPVFDDTELRKFCDAMAEAFGEELPFIELRDAALTETGVTVDDGMGTTYTGDVDDPTVEGGVE